MILNYTLAQDWTLLSGLMELASRALYAEFA